jgi:UDP-3-O-[3-hydroxymyristoyl] glucosamine N-acyltransferase
MEFSAQQIATLLDGTVDGNQRITINKLSKIEEGSVGSLSFLANPKYTHHFYSTQASIVIVNKDFIPEYPYNCTLIRVDDAYSAFARLLDIYNELIHRKTGISEKAHISETAKIGEEVFIGEFVFIGHNTTIGSNTRIYPNTVIADNSLIGEGTTLFAGVQIYSNTVIGKNCVIHAGAVIGADGFGFAPQNGNIYKKVAQTGNVVIEDNVEIGANTTIDRATLGSTLICSGVKLDNLIQIAHNVIIGKNTVIASQTGVSGSTKIGENCMIGGQVGITGHLTIANNVKIAAQSGISHDIKEEGAIVMGSPAFEISKYKKILVHFKNLNTIAERIDKLEKELLKQKKKK